MQIAFEKVEDNG